MNKQNILTSLIVAVVVVVLGFTIFGGKSTNTITERRVEVPIVGSTGQTESFRKFFSQGAALGGIIATTSAVTLTSYTLAQRDLDNASVILWTPNISMTINLNSTSTLALVPNIGDTATIYFRNATTTAAASITFAASDAGADLQFAEATGGDLVLTGLDWEKITIIHTSQFLTTFILDEMTEAD